jgi:hypothetical protein
MTFVDHFFCNMLVLYLFSSFSTAYRYGLDLVPRAIGDLCSIKNRRGTDIFAFPLPKLIVSQLRLSTIDFSLWAAITRLSADQDLVQVGEILAYLPLTVLRRHSPKALLARSEHHVWC